MLSLSFNRETQQTSENLTCGHVRVHELSLCSGTNGSRRLPAARQLKAQ